MDNCHVRRGNTIAIRGPNRDDVHCNEIIGNSPADLIVVVGKELDVVAA